MNATIPNDLISPRQAGLLVGVRRETIWRWIQAGRVRAWQLPTGHQRVSRADVLGLLQEIRTGLDDQPGRHGI